MSTAHSHLMRAYARQPVSFVRGSGALLWDEQGVEYLDPGFDQLLGPFVCLHHKLADFLVDLLGGLLTIVLMLGDLPPQKDHFLLLPKGEGPHLVTHPPLTNHLVSNLGCPFDVVPCPGGHPLEHQLLCHTTSK